MYPFLQIWASAPVTVSLQVASLKHNTGYVLYISCCAAKEKCMDTIEMDYSMADIGQDSWREQFPGNDFEVNFICAPASSFFFLEKKIKLMRVRRPRWYSCGRTDKTDLSNWRWQDQDQHNLCCDENQAQAGHKRSMNWSRIYDMVRSRCGSVWRIRIPSRRCPSVHIVRPGVPLMHDHPLVHYSDKL